MAGPDDIVLIAGKGHEKYQEIKGVKHHFDDKEVLKEVFELLGK
jgi:UDP-N-acetylmuramoyl-L-alanyl-D-glutamate--2,6-diaminopimelate ligase